MTDKLTGHCLCGGVRFECASPGRVTYYCHCEDCRRSSGSAFHVGVVVGADELRITQGTVKTFTVTADSGNALVREFCPDCGSQMFMRTPATATLVAINAGSLDNPDAVAPSASLWTDSKIGWVRMAGDVDCLARGGLWKQFA